MKIATVMLISTCTALAEQAPTADEIVGRMMESDQARQASLRAYNWTSHYVLDNQERHAEMTVRWTRQADGTKLVSHPLVAQHHPQKNDQEEE